MKEVSAKYPIKIGKMLVTADTVGKIADMEEVRNVFPGFGKSGKGGDFVAVSFPGLDWCVCHVKQLIFHPQL